MAEQPQRNRQSRRGGGNNQRTRDHQQSTSGASNYQQNSEEGDNSQYQQNRRGGSNRRGGRGGSRPQTGATKHTESQGAQKQYKPKVTGSGAAQVNTELFDEFKNALFQGMSADKQPPSDQPAAQTLEQKPVNAQTQDQKQIDQNAVIVDQTKTKHDQTSVLTNPVQSDPVGNTRTVTYVQPSSAQPKKPQQQKKQQPKPKKPVGKKQQSDEQSNTAADADKSVEVAEKAEQVKKEKPEEKPAAAMGFGGWFSQAVIDNSKGATVFVKDYSADEEFDDQDKNKPSNKKSKTSQSDNKRAKKGQKQPEDKKVADDKNQAGTKAENPFKIEKSQKVDKGQGPISGDQKTTEEDHKETENDEGTEEEKKQEASRPFDPEIDGKSWDSIDLGSMLMQGNKKRNIKEAKKIVVQVKQSELVRVRNDVKLKLTEDIEFSMTHFAKPNKGFSNAQQINCFMNVCLQSLLACPALFNLLQAIGNHPEIEDTLDSNGLLKKFVYVSKFFDEANQMDPNSVFARRVVNSEHIFEPFLAAYNPDQEQQDACDFLCYLLDQMHEELKLIYVPQVNKEVIKANVRAQDEWSNAGALKQKMAQENTESLFEPSLIRDIFGGVQQTEIHIEGQKSISVSHEPFFVLNLEIPRTGDKNLQTCLASYFQERPIQDYQFKGRTVRATHKQLISRLPNMLCLQLKRFIFTDRPIKMKEFVSFDEVLTIPDSIQAPSLRLGIFNENRQNRKQQPSYRLFSVVEHVGAFAHRGHYVSYTMDSDDQWKKFDDNLVQVRDLDTVLDETSAYILFYELIQ